MSDPDLTPAEDQVRRLLADARHDEPMPAEVVDRLDGVLAGLRHESRRTSAPVDLAARRRRRIARAALVAAAAVVVLGVGISRVDLSGSDDGAGSADSGAGSAAQESARDDAPNSDSLSAAAPPLVLSSEGFDDQVRRLSSRVPRPNTLDSGSSSPDGLSDGTAPLARTWCDDPSWGRGSRIEVRYDGERGVLVLRPPADDSRVADLYLCGETTPTRSTTIPAG